MKRTIAAIAGAALAYLLVAGCATSGPGADGSRTTGPGASSSDGVAPSSVESSSSAPSTSGDAASTASETPVAYDDSPDAVLIRISSVRATIAGLQGMSEVTLFGDGRVRTVTEDGERTEARISAASVQQLADLAAPLLDAEDPGSPVTDVGWTDITIRVDGRTVELRMGAIPSSVDLDMPADVQRTREAIAEVQRGLSGLQGLEVEAPASTLPPATPASGVSTRPTTAPTTASPTAPTTASPTAPTTASPTAPPPPTS